MPDALVPIPIFFLIHLLLFKFLNHFIEMRTHYGLIIFLCSVKIFRSDNWIDNMR